MLQRDTLKSQELSSSDNDNLPIYSLDHDHPTEDKPT